MNDSEDNCFLVWNFEDLTITCVVNEIENLGFLYENQIYDILRHYNGLESSYVDTFLKKTE